MGRIFNENNQEGIVTGRILNQNNRERTHRERILNEKCLKTTTKALTGKILNLNTFF